MTNRRTMSWWMLLAVSALAAPGFAETPKSDSPDEAALRKASAAFVEAFNRGDAKALAAFWTADGDSIDADGERLSGQDAIAEALTAFFAESKGATLRIDTESIRLVGPDVALEDGTTEVTVPGGGPPRVARYANVHVKKDGQWRLASVRESPFTPPSNYEHLQDLDWVVGDWVDDASGEVAQASFSWTMDRNFLVASFQTDLAGVPVAGGTQWIGWDPVAKQIRSWTFDSSGGFGEGTWARDGDAWAVRTTSTLRDGKKVTATNVVKRLDANTISWQSPERAVDGKPLPPAPVVRMKRRGG